VAWLYSLYRGQLSEYFQLYQPPLAVIQTLLNKHRLQQACSEVGLETPASWFIDEPDDLTRLEAELPYPLVVKPRTQILRWPHNKGRLTRSREALRRTYDEVAHSATYSPVLVEHDPTVVRPFLQEFVPHTAQGIYNLSGFVDETGELYVVRASRKVLQRPRGLGVGVCFEEADTDLPLAGRVLALCRHVGYYGVFEVEFIKQGSRFLLIDFNPRFYGQMAFDIARGLPLPLMTYEAALGRRDQLQAIVQCSREPPAGSRVFSNRIDLAVLLRLQRLAGNMGSAEGARWWAWMAEHKGAITDAVIDPSDRCPQLVYIADQVLGLLRHPRGFLREFGSGV
jgi:predicted ATP-grasp superfamily ATP-dependent carboligase